MLLKLEFDYRTCLQFHTEPCQSTSLQETINVEASISDSAVLIPQERRETSRVISFVLVFLLLALLVLGIFSGLYEIFVEGKLHT